MWWKPTWAPWTGCAPPKAATDSIALVMAVCVANSDRAPLCWRVGSGCEQKNALCKATPDVWERLHSGQD